MVGLKYVFVYLVIYSIIGTTWWEYEREVYGEAKMVGYHRVIAMILALSVMVNILIGKKLWEDYRGRI